MVDMILFYGLPRCYVPQAVTLAQLNAAVDPAVINRLKATIADDLAARYDGAITALINQATAFDAPLAKDFLLRYQNSSAGQATDDKPSIVDVCNQYQAGSDAVGNLIARYRQQSRQEQKDFGPNDWAILKQLQDLVACHVDNVNLLNAPGNQGYLVQYMTQKTALNDALDSYWTQRSRNQFQYKGFFSCFGFSREQKKAAVEALKLALNGEAVDLVPHLGALRNGKLGERLRAVVKTRQGNLIAGTRCETVRDFVAALGARVATENQPLDVQETVPPPP
jgi:hypothetical protein